ncbi:MAG: hypothetical protein ABI282_03110 [Candidatus Baltobacteraceae bacterium]
MDYATARQVGEAFEAMLLKQCLGSLAHKSDVIGEYGIDAIARSIAQRDADGFGALLAARMNPDAE